MNRLGQNAVLAIAIVFLFGYALKTGRAATHHEQLKIQREAIERTARLLIELEQQIKKLRQAPKPKQAKIKGPRVGTKNDEDDEEEEKV